MRPPKTRRLVSSVALVALVGASFAFPISVAARDPQADVFGDAAEAFAEPGTGALSESGSRGFIDPEALPAAAVDTAAPPAKPFLSWPTEAAGAQPPDVTGAPVAPDPVEYSETTSPPASGPGFDGFTRTSGPSTSSQPPDPWVAVGPDHLIQVVNTSVQILDRTGTVLLSASLADFFDLPAGYVSADPRVIYDSLHQRWVMTQVSWTCFDVGGGVGYIDYLVSSTADPTDPWRLDYLGFDGFLPDYPAAGTSTVNLALAANIFEMNLTQNCVGGGTSYVGTDLLFADWAQVVRPTGDTDWAEYFLAGLDGFFTFRAAVQTPAISPTVHAVIQWDDPDDATDTIIPGYFAFTGSVVAGTIDLTGTNHLTADGVVAPFIEPPDPQQPGTTPTVTDRIDSRPTDAIWQANRMTWVSTNGCTPDGDTTERACVRVTQISTSGGVPAPLQDFLVAEAGHDKYFGGIGEALDGTLHVVWASSGAAEYPSSFTGYQLLADAANSLSAPQLLKAGVAPSFTGGRWGDYVGVAQDPQVPNAVWQGNMYSGGGSLWKTWISQLQTGGSSYVPIPPERVLDTRPGIAIGLSGVFAANTPRTFQVTDGSLIPDEAIAVTGNLTVVGQTAAGYVSVTPTPVVNPASSTLNFPLGDTRANNVTIPLSASGGLSAVYKAPAGRTTHLILDITGYFLPGDVEGTYTTLGPVRVLDSRAGIGIGLSGPFAPNTPRTIDIGGTNGVPADAVAITGNLTVVGQTRAGYLSITPDPEVNPATSTLNFPLADTRANGVSVPLNGTGEISIVYKASGGSTNVILDVTGYYREDPAGLLFYPLTPGRVMDTRNVPLSGLSGPFSANVPRRLDVAGHWGAPLGAAAITGNLTVVGQTAAGYVSATLASDTTPDTSVLNFPLGDIRANGATLPLNGQGREWFVYKAASGRTTHLILDLSGYFR